MFIHRSEIDFLLGFLLLGYILFPISLVFIMVFLEFQYNFGDFCVCFSVF